MTVHQDHHIVQGKNGYYCQTCAQLEQELYAALNIIRAYRFAKSEVERNEGIAVVDVWIKRVEQRFISGIG